MQVGFPFPDMFNIHKKLKRGKPESNFTTLGFLMAALFENEFGGFCLRSKNTGKVYSNFVYFKLEINCLNIS